MSSQNQTPIMQHEARGNGEPLVLLPGGLTGWLSWIPHSEALAESRKVIRLQLKHVELGLAGTPLPPDYSMDYEAVALGNTLDYLKITQADFAAWSNGGQVALNYAIYHPERVRSLTLIEPNAYWVLHSRGPYPQALLDEIGFIRTLATDDVSEEQLISFLRAVRIAPPDVDPHTMPPWESWYKHRQSLRIGDIPLTHEDDIDLVRAFDKPVLLVKGEGSSPFLHSIIDVLAEELPNRDVVTFPAGHAPHLVSMQPFMERFMQFLSEQN